VELQRATEDCGTKFNSDTGWLQVTKRQTTLLLGVIALLVIGSTGVAVFLYTGSPSNATSSSHTSSGSTSTTDQTTSSSATTWFKVNYNTIEVGYNSGLWNLQIQDVGGKQVKELTAILKTPTESKMCTGIFGGLIFSNCPSLPPASGAFDANMTFTGYATGVGPGSATPGNSYQVIIDAVFADGTAANDTITAVATSG
jgi:hypothetical protein